MRSALSNASTRRATLVAGQHRGRGQAQHGAGDHRMVHDHPGTEEFEDRLAGQPRAGELHADQQPDPAYLADQVRVGGGHRLQAGQQLGAELRRPVDQSLVRDGRDRRSGGRHRDRRAGECRRVQERVLVEGLERVGRGDHGGDRHDAAGQALPGQQHIRSDVLPVGAPPVTESADAGEDLVEHQECAVLPAQPGRFAQVAGRGNHHSALALHRLQDHAGRRPAGQRGTQRLGVAVRHVRDVRQQRAEGLLVEILPGDGQGAHGLTVVAADGRDESAPAMGAGHLDGRLHGLRAGAREVHPGQAGWRHRDERRRGVAHRRLQQQAGRYRVALNLRDDRGDHGRVPGTVEEHAVATGVEEAVTVRGVDPCALGTDLDVPTEHVAELRAAPGQVPAVVVPYRVPYLGIRL